MRNATYEMLHDRFARELAWRFEVYAAVGVAIAALYVMIHRVF
jgi:hypothetical protein